MILIGDSLLENSNSLTKHTLLTKENEIAASICFISKGILRIFYLKDYTETTGFIFSEGLFAGSYESFLLRTKSNQTLGALEDGVLLSMDYPSLQILYKKDSNEFKSQ